MDRLLLLHEHTALGRRSFSRSLRRQTHHKHLQFPVEAPLRPLSSSSDQAWLFCRALKTVLGESCDAVAQAQAMSYLNLAWGLGTILGPVIGGYFAYPCENIFSPGSFLCTPGGVMQTRCATIARVPKAILAGPSHESPQFGDCLHCVEAWLCQP